MRCFEESSSLNLLDRETFKFQHKLMGHPALSLENLARVLPALSDGRVKHSKGFLKNGDDFETVMCKDPVRTLTIEETIEQIRVSDSYIMVDGPEEDASFKDLYRELIGDVEQVMRRCGVGNQVTDPRLFMFIASPNSITPFHIDRYSNFLMQFRGSKEVSVFLSGTTRWSVPRTAKPTWRCKTPSCLGSPSSTRWRSSTISVRATRCTFRSLPDTMCATARKTCRFRCRSFSAPAKAWPGRTRCASTMRHAVRCGVSA